MPDKTLSQINEELNQHLAAITKLQLDIQTHTTEVRELLKERDDLEAGPLEAIGIHRPAVTARDGVPIVTRSARAKPVKEGPTTKELRAWAADAGWTYQGESVSKWPNR